MGNTWIDPQKFRKAKTLLSDLYDYFRMESSMDPIILFEHLCCLMFKISPEPWTPLHVDSAAEAVAQYQQKIAEFKTRGIAEKIDIDPSAFLHWPELLRRLLDTADELWELIKSNGDMAILLSDFLETIVQSRRDDTIRTPRRTAREIVQLLFRSNYSAQNRRILDPACGSGAFLLATLELLEVRGLITHHSAEGLERDTHLRNCALLLTLLYDRGKISTEVRDGGSPVRIEEEGYDFILANPPFRTQSLRDREMLGDYLELPVPTKDTHRAFLQRTLLGLKPGGRCAVIVPDSFLTHTSSDAVQVRCWIVEEFRCMGIVKLPAYTFYPQASVNASVLFIQKPEPNKRYQHLEGGIFFFTVELDGQSNDTRRVNVPRNDFNELRQIWDERDALWREWCWGDRTHNVYGMDVPVQWSYPRFWFGSLEDIRRGDYSLLAEQYQPVRIPDGEVQDPEKVLEEIRKLGREIMDLTQQLTEAEDWWTISGTRHS